MVGEQFGKRWLALISEDPGIWHRRCLWDHQEDGGVVGGAGLRWQEG